MQNWQNERVEAIQFLIANPVWLVPILGFALISYWLYSRMFRSVLTKQAKANRIGWDVGASKATRRHDTGIGTQEVLVMQPPKRVISISLMTLFFFGGGAVFFWLAVLPDPAERTVENYFAFAVMCSFSVVAVYLFTTAFTRIEVSKTDIQRRRLFRRRQSFALNTLSDVQPAGRNPATGVKLIFAADRSLRLLASFKGYAQVLERLRPFHPKINRYLLLGRMVDNATRPKLG